METIQLNEIGDALSLMGMSLGRNCIYIIINFALWLSGIIIFYSSYSKLNASSTRNKKIKIVFEQIKKSEWIYFFVFVVLTLFILIIEAFLFEIPASEIPEKLINLRNVVYLLFSLIIPQVSRINTYVNFNKIF